MMEHQAPINGFRPEVIESLDFYVYRLIDPRNGETFYVGKGRGDRIFAHGRAEITATSEERDPKLERIWEIRGAGLEVGLVIHSHPLKEDVAFLIETAVMDCYPGIENKADGHRPAIFGPIHVREVVAAYEAEQLEQQESLILISIARTFGKRDTMQATQAAWGIQPANAENFRLVLGFSNGLVRGAYRPQAWLPAIREHFPWLEEDFPNKVGFVGREAEPPICSSYVGKRVPKEWRLYGGSFRYVSMPAS